jgi:hypothetical protein
MDPSRTTGAILRNGCSGHKWSKRGEAALYLREVTPVRYPDEGFFQCQFSGECLLVQVLEKRTMVLPGGAYSQAEETTYIQ